MADGVKSSQLQPVAFGEGVGCGSKLKDLLLASSILCVTTALLTSATFAQEDASTTLAPIVIDGQGPGDSPTGPDNSIVATRSKGASKTNTPLRETPQAVSVVTRKQMQEQGANTASESLRYTPGAFPESNGYDVRYDWLYIRGMQTHTWLDGLALPSDPSSYANPSINPYMLERIEVLKGPSSVLYGRNPPGGLVNYVSKRPQTTPHNEVELRTSAYGGLQSSIDSTGSLTPDGVWSYRFAAQGRNMGSQIDDERDRQFTIAPSLTWAPTADTSLTLHGYYQKDDPKDFNPRFYPAVGTLLPNPNGQIPRDINFGNEGANEFNRDFYTLGYEFSHRFNETFTVRQNLRYGRSSQDMFLTLVNPAFAYQPDGHTLNRVSGASDDVLTAFNVDTQLEARFDTGAFDHTMLLGLDYLNATSDRKFGNSPLGVPSFDYLKPDYTPVNIPYPAYSTSVHQAQRQIGFYAQDQIRYDNWLATFGARYDMSEITSTDRIKSSVSQNDDEKLSARAGLTYLFDNGLAPYVSYTTSFMPLIGVDANGEPYKAQQAEQFEAGVKYEPVGGRGMVTLSLFHLNLENALTPADSGRPMLGSVQSGKQRIRGLEIEGKYELTPEIDLLAAYSYTDSAVTASNRPVELGREVLRLPQHQGSIWASYRPSAIPGLGLSAGVRALSSYQSDPNYLAELRIPGRALVDIGAEYDFGALKPEFAGTKLRVNVSNLFDKKYVSHCLNATGGSCNYGAGRNISASLKYQW